eukprot:3274632-Pleurochrysis_carterae.AAC.1
MESEPGKVRPTSVTRVRTQFVTTLKFQQSPRGSSHLLLGGTSLSRPPFARQAVRESAEQFSA